MLRVYPKGIRFDSSNYDPFIGWAHGAQMVAFNMQVRFLFLVSPVGPCFFKIQSPFEHYPLLLHKI